MSLPASRSTRVDIQVRAAVEADREALFAVYGQALRGFIEGLWGWDEAWQRRDFGRHFRPAEITVLTEADRVVGYVQVEHHADEVWLRMIALRPDYQGRGLGGSLLRQVIEKANVQARDVALVVFKNNPGARRFYERFGFRVEAEKAMHYAMRRKAS